jgi:hypothetical protein
VRESSANRRPYVFLHFLRRRNTRDAAATPTKTKEEGSGIAPAMIGTPGCVSHAHESITSEKWIPDTLLRVTIADILNPTVVNTIGCHELHTNIGVGELHRVGAEIESES